jgi:autotransporter-associated beta strand protein
VALRIATVKRLALADRAPPRRLRLLPMLLGTTCLGAAMAPGAMAQTADIPLQYQATSQGLQLTINVGIGGQAPNSYVFDTGSTYFNAVYSTAAFGSIPSSQAGLPMGVQESFGDGSAIISNFVNVPSLTFYPTSSTPAGSPSGVTLNAVTPAGTPTNFLVGAITNAIPPFPQGAVAGGYTGYYGVFGASNFLQSANGTLIGSIPGEAVLPGTTAGYVVAANGQALSTIQPGAPGATVNGPQVGQSVTSCSPCVMDGLTPALLAQFKSVNTIAYAADAHNFPISNAPSSATVSDLTMTYTVSATGKVSVTATGSVLLDTGTNSYVLNGSPAAYSQFGPGSMLTVSGTATGSTTDAITLFSSGVYSDEVAATGSSIFGLGFFLQNSVLYNLAGNAVGYTPNFVTDTNITTTTASPLIVDSSSVPLGLAGVISGPGGVFINSGGSATLSGTNTYMGATSINNGYLALVGPGSIATSSGVSVNSTGVFDISGVTAGAAIKSLSGDTTGFVSLGAQTLTLTAANGTFGGTMFGNGALAITGSTGSGLVLTGINTYQGGTSVSGGTATDPTTLGITNSGALGPGPLSLGATGTDVTTLVLNGTGINFANLVTVTGDPAIVVATGNTNTMSNVINGAGDVVADGGGRLVLSGANTYSGGTVICGAARDSLCLTANANPTTATTLQVGVDTVYNTANTPSSGIKSSAIGTATLTFDGGTLQGGGATTNYQIANAVQINGAGGTIDADHGNFTLIGNITNGNATTGSLTIEDTTGHSTIFVSGTNTYSGQTIIASTGALQAGSTGALSPNSAFSVAGVLELASFSNTIYSLSGTGIVGGGATLTIAPSTGTTTFSGVLENQTSALSIIKSGTGTQVFSGTLNTYTGTTTVNGGVLEVDGSIATSSLTTVNTAAALTGTGTVGATTIAGNGTFAPGSATPGSFMTVSSLTLQTGAQYMVQLNPTTSSFAKVTGTASLGAGLATVDALYASGSYVSRTYTILTAGNVSGTFGSLVNTNLPSGFHTSLSYDANDAYLNLVLSFVPPPGSGLSGNQQNVGNAITGFFNSNGSIPLVFGGLTPAGLTQISGETAVGSQQTTFDAMTQFLGVMTDPFIDGRGNGVSAGGSAATGYASTQKPAAARDAYAMFTKAPVASFEQRWSVWAAGFGGSQTTDGNTTLGSNSATSRVYGTAVGADYRFSPDTIAGFALAGGGTNFSVVNAGTGRSDLFQAGAFIRHTVGPAYISAALAYGWQDITTDRIVTVAGVDHLRAEFNANAFSGRVEGGYRFVTPLLGGIGLTPYVAAQFTTFDLPAYAEGVVSGANTFALSYGAKSVTDARSEIGLRTDKSWALTDSILMLRSRFGWAHDFDPDRSIGATFQSLPGASFVVNGAAQAHDSALTTASAEIKWRSGFSLAATFEGEFSGVTRSYAGKGVARYAW